MTHFRIAGESTKDWLERLIVIKAPKDIRRNVQAILESESRIAVNQQGTSNTYPVCAY